MITQKVNNLQEAEEHIANVVNRLLDFHQQISKDEVLKEENIVLIHQGIYVDEKVKNAKSIMQMLKLQKKIHPIENLQTCLNVLVYTLKHQGLSQKDILALCSEQLIMALKYVNQGEEVHTTSF